MAWRARLRSYYDENERAIKAGTLVNAIIYVPALALLVTVMFAGVIGGWMAGNMTPRHGPSARNGAVAGALGPALTTVVVSVAGALAWPVFGHTILLEGAVNLLGLATVAVPLFAAEGAVGGLAASYFVDLG